MEGNLGPSWVGAVLLGEDEWPLQNKFGVIMQYFNGFRALSIPYAIWLNLWLPAKHVANIIALLFEEFNSPLTSTNKNALFKVSPLWSLKFSNGNLNDDFILLVQNNFEKTRKIILTQNQSKTPN